AAQRPMRDIIAGGMGKVVSLGEKLSPRLTDKYMERSTFDSQKTDVPLRADRADNLYEPVADDGGERGHFAGRVHRWSAYTEAVLHPKRAAVAIAAAGAALVTARRVVRDRDHAGD